MQITYAPSEGWFLLHILIQSPGLVNKYNFKEYNFDNNIMMLAVFHPNQTRVSARSVLPLEKAFRH